MHSGGCGFESRPIHHFILAFALNAFTYENMYICDKSPYKGCKIYGPIFHRKEGRNMINIVFPDKTRTTLSYARFIMSTHLGRKLSRAETVDHINEDRLDDRLDNLQILSREENSRKHVIEKQTRKMVDLKCPNCGVIFSRRRGLSHLCKPGQRYTACSRKCAGALRAKERMGNSVDFSDNLVREYTRACS